MTMVHFYENILRWALQNKWKFLMIPAFTLLFGLLTWHRMGKEFMPSLNEGSFLLMPTSMPHSSIEKNLEYIQTLDKRLSTIPEVEVAVGKWGRVNSALDPAPIQMFENTINYRTEYILDENGHRMQFKVDRNGNYILKNNKMYNPQKETFRIIPSDSLIPDKNGEYFRQWRPGIKKPLDIWNEIVRVTDIPGLTSAPKLQPIETRLIMLSTGMRAPMGLKVFGPDLNSIEKAGLMFEKTLKDVPSIKASAVFYDRAVGAPYLEIKLDREAMARYGMTVSEVQEVLQVAVGGMTLSTSVEGRERFPLRVRYARELRDNPEDIKRILVPAMNGVQIPLGEIADIDYTSGAQMIRSENTFLVGFVIFDKLEGKAEVEVVEEAGKIIKEKIDSGEITLPPGVTYKFAGNYENQSRATKSLAIVVPISLILILLLLYFQFRTITASFIHFSGVFVAFSGGFIMLWLYGQDWFMNFSVAGLNLRDMFQMHTINLSVAVWVGFIALFGIATNDGVIMGTYIHQVFEDKKPSSVHDIREAIVMAGKKRVRPAMMTTAVAVIALLPVLSSTGKGADIMVPMAIPMFGGMVIQVMTVFVVPLFQSMWREAEVIHKNKIAV
jgi:Cu(I)/Ag(I) efflux system membrane protein CusA/SilA